MYTTHDNIVALPASVVMDICNIPKGTYDSYVSRGHLQVVRRGAYKRPALLAFNTLPDAIKQAVVVKLGPPTDKAKYQPFKERIGINADAVKYFTTRMLGFDKGQDAARRYIATANVLDAIHAEYTDFIQARAKNGKSTNGFWPAMADAVKSIYSEELPHTLPFGKANSYRRLKDVYETYVADGFESLVSKNYGNKKALKVNERVELILKSLYTMPNKPFGADVHALYTMFIAGQLDVVNNETGELLNPADFTKNGKPIEISEVTVRNWLNRPENKIVVAGKRSGQHRFGTTHRPHVHRHKPQFSFSKISMDDRDLPRKLHNGQRVKQYLAYDVHSGAIVGYAHSLNKDEKLFKDVLRNMFCTIQANGFGMPLEVEVENHLVNKFFDDLQVMFPFTRICRPGNSQEKSAEHFNRQLKYGVERPQQGGNIGRWWAKGEGYQADADKVNDEFVEKTFSYEQLVADAERAIVTYNNQEHPKHKGLTRWAVLQQNQNPACAQVNNAVVARYAGFSTQCTLVRNHYVNVQHAKYALPHISHISKLKPNNYSLTAYYMPGVDGSIPQVYLYQGDAFICVADKITTFNLAQAERTGADYAAMQEQFEFVGGFDKHVKQGKAQLQKLTVLNPHTQPDYTAEVKIVQPLPQAEPVIPQSFNKADLRRGMIEDL